MVNWIGEICTHFYQHLEYLRVAKVAAQVQRTPAHVGFIATCCDIYIFAKQLAITLTDHNSYHNTSASSQLSQNSVQLYDINHGS